MKKMNKLLALVLAMVMVLGLATVASAATVNVPADGILKDHTFTAYQIFSGREEGNVLSDVEWGNGINSADFLAALKGDATHGALFTDCNDAAAVAKVLGDNNTNTALANAVAKLAYANKTGNGTALTTGDNTLADGYYLVVDTTANVGEGGAYNASLLQVVGTVNITVKTDAPSVEKKVYENVKTIATPNEYGTNYNDVADYNIGDAVPFHLIGSVPDMSRYDTYKYIFHDTLSDGLSLNADSIKVYVASDKAGTDKAEISDWTKDVNGQSFTVSFADLKTVSGVDQGKYIIVEYTATLNENAKIGLPGNPNGVYLEYSNKPDQSGSGDNDNTGKTPEDYVIVFTYELDTTKVDGQNPDTKLKDAKFVLLNSDGTKVAQISNGKFAGWTNLPAVGEDGKIAANSWEANTVLTSAETTGLFSVVGLDDGTYKLREIVAPAGYNLLADDIVVVISATTENGQNWVGSAAGDTAGTALTNLAVKADNKDGTGDKDTGIASITVANNKGSTLPETGGIGTTIFYVLGGMLVVCAVVLMVSKKRMSAEG